MAENAESRFYRQAYGQVSCAAPKIRNWKPVSGIGAVPVVGCPARTVTVPVKPLLH